MPVTVNVNGLSLCHQLSGGVSTATLPDVCVTPGAGPVPYPNVAFSRDLAKGTTTVSADGADMCANFGSEFSRSTGDEPGTGGGVASHVNTREATWLTYSFDVKLEGKGACRLTDKMFHNHRNTVNMAGVLQPPVRKPPNDPNCARLYEIIYELIWGQRTPPAPGGGFPQGTKGMAWRWQEAAENVGNWSPERNATHLREYEKLQNKLKDTLRQWRNKKQRDCGDDDLPPGADEYAEQVPELGPGKPVAPKPSTPQFKEYLKAAGISVAGAAGVVLTLIIISRIIRLFPPLLPLELSPI